MGAMMGTRRWFFRRKNLLMERAGVSFDLVTRGIRCILGLSIFDCAGGISTK